MTGFLNDLKLSSVSPDPNYMPEGKYPAIVSKLQVKKNEEKNTSALIITYKITHHDPENQGKLKTEFKQLPHVDPETGEISKDEDSARNASYLKQRLLSLGVPDDAQMDQLSQDDLLGTPVWITLVKSGDYTNVRGVELREEDGYTGQL